MASTRSVRQGQIEVGIIEHNGHEFAAYGATVNTIVTQPKEENNNGGDQPRR